MYRSKTYDELEIVGIPQASTLMDDDGKSQYGPSNDGEHYSWTVLCGEDCEAVCIPNPVFDEIPFFVALSNSGMEETYSKVITKPDIRADTMRTIIKLLQFHMDTSEFKKNFVNYAKDFHVTASETLDIVIHTYNMYFPTDEMRIATAKKKLREYALFKHVKAIISTLNLMELEDLQNALDQLNISQIKKKMNEVMSISRKWSDFKRKDIKLCANYFGSDVGCLLHLKNIKCPYSHVCDPEKRQQNVALAMKIIASKKKGKKNKYYLFSNAYEMCTSFEFIKFWAFCIFLSFLCLHQKFAFVNDLLT